MNRLVQTAAVAGLLWAGVAVWAAPSLDETRRRTQQAHLVGHEDELLLKRIEDALGEWDPRNLQSPYLIQTKAEPILKGTAVVGERARYALRRPDLAEFIADPDAAVALGKALYWEMQAGSDSGLKDKDGHLLGTACASCHFRFGTDTRNRNTEALAYQAWEKFAVGRTGVTAPVDDTPVEKPSFTQRSLPFTPNGQQGIARTRFAAAGPGLLQHEILGSAGMIFRTYLGWDSGNQVENAADQTVPDARLRRLDMFAVPQGTIMQRTRQVTQRNSPTVINAIFNDRQFHDGRAESTFNGFSVFGDFDKRVILKKAFLRPDGTTASFLPVPVALVNASLASQAVGPIVNEVEMSYQGRNFHDLAAKLLPAQPLRNQTVSGTDSVLGGFVKPGAPGLFDVKVGANAPPAFTPANYRTMIQRAFRKEWWADDKALTSDAALTARLAGARHRFAAQVAAQPTPTLKHTQLKNALTTKLASNPPPPFPAQDAVNAILVKFPTEEGRSLELTALLASGGEWMEAEAEILPLRLYTPVNRTDADVQLVTRITTLPGASAPLTARDDLMVNNFSLYWGLSIMLYESTLISNRSPFDEMMRGNSAPVDALFARLVTEPVAVNATEPQDDADLSVPNARRADEKIRKVQLDKFITKHAPPTLSGTAMFQRGFRVFVLNCAGCHEPPFFTAAAELELAPELPEPIAQLHAHSLIRTALADAFKTRLLEQGQPPGGGVTDANRNLLGARRFFFDQERIPELEATQAPLLIENMLTPDRRPTSFNTVAGPGLPAPSRVPMISWVGTRPPLGFAPTPQLGEKPVDPYAFYDVGFYNLGVAEPRYDWGVWKFAADGARENAAGLGFVIGAVTPGAPATQTAEEVAGGVSSLGSAYTLPRRFTASAITGVGFTQGIPSNLPLEDHSRERGWLDDPARRGEMHFFKRSRRMVMTEETWGHRKAFITDHELAGWGAFKAPSLRNVSLTEPYMHNGRFLSLRQVLKFYSFDNPDLIPASVELNPDLHPEMGRLAFDSDGTVFDPNGQPLGPPNITQIQDAEAVLFFLHCLTDDRVAKEAAPFDHPSIRVTNGFSTGAGVQDESIAISEIGSEGAALPPGVVQLPQFPADR